MDRRGGGRHEASVRQTDSIHAERKALRDVPAIFSHLKIQAELVPHGHQFALRNESRTLRVAHLDPKLSAVLLRCGRKNEDAYYPQKTDDSSNERVHHFVKYQANLNATHPVARLHRRTNAHSKNTANFWVAPSEGAWLPVRRTALAVIEVWL